MSETEYNPTEDDILAALHYLRLNVPRLATPENAIKLLVHDNAYHKALEELYPEEIEKILKDLEDH